jgi:hypothetical protein
VTAGSVVPSRIFGIIMAQPTDWGALPHATCWSAR